MSRAVNATESMYSLESYELELRGAPIFVQETALSEWMLPADAPSRYQVLPLGYLEQPGTYNRYTATALEIARQHGQRLCAVTFETHHSMHSQADQTEALIAVADSTFTRAQRTAQHRDEAALDVVGHSRGAKTAILAGETLAAHGMLGRVWGLTPAGLDPLRLPLSVAEMRETVVSGAREVAGDVGAIIDLADKKSLRSVGSFFLRMAKNVADIGGFIGEAHELRTEMIADKAAALSNNRNIKDMGMVLGLRDGICRARNIRANLRACGFTGWIVDEDITHLGPLRNPRIAKTVNEILYASYVDLRAA